MYFATSSQRLIDTLPVEVTSLAYQFASRREIAPGSSATRKLTSTAGGSEFAAEFELACQQKELPLFVLPPKSPKLNAHVERSHRTYNEEFYQVHAESDQVPALNSQPRHCEKTYNCIRPHQSLGYLTPLEFITRWKRNLRKAKCH